MGHAASKALHSVGHAFEEGWHYTEEGAQKAYNAVKDPLKDIKYLQQGLAWVNTELDDGTQWVEKQGDNILKLSLIHI